MSKTEVFLEGQRAVIVGQLSKAKSLILVAVAYFTDENLFRILLKKAKEGVKVQLIVRDDEINIMSGIDYNSLKELNGDFCYNKNLHHKFCVIDGLTVLSGSYNWTHQARRNHEDLTLIEGDLNTAAMFMVKFFKIKDPLHSIRRASLQRTDRNIEGDDSSNAKRVERRTGIITKMEARRKRLNQKNTGNDLPTNEGTAE